MKALEFARMLSEVTQQGSQWSAQCPVHHGTRPSLFFRDGEHSLTVTCQEGCTKEAICVALKKDPKELFPEKKREPRSQESSWHIKDLWGRTVAVHKCLEFSNGKKELSWETPKGKIGLRGLRVEELPLYGSDQIPRFDKSRWVYLCEGEAATDALLALGGQALGTVTGVESLPSKDAFEPLRGYRVAFWPSNHEEGRDHMQRAKKLLKDIARELITLDTRNLPPKGSTLQWVEAMLQTSLTKVGLRELLQQEEIPGLPRETLFSIAPKHKPKLRTRTIDELLEMELTAPEPLLGQWLTRNSLGVVSADTKASRTWFCVEVAYALATGGAFLQWKASRPCTVLFVDSETPLKTLCDQLRQSSLFPGEHGREHLREHLRMLSFDDPENPDLLLDLCTHEGQEAIREQLGGVEVLVVNGTPSWLFSSDKKSATEWLMGLRREGLGILLAKSASQQLGLPEDAFDYAVRVETPKWKPACGTPFTVTLQEADHELGGIENNATEVARDKAPQNTQSEGSEKRQAILQLREEGLKVNEIARQLQTAKSYVSRTISKHKTSRGGFKS